MLITSKQEVKYETNILSFCTTTCLHSLQLNRYTALVQALRFQEPSCGNFVFSKEKNVMQGFLKPKLNLPRISMVLLASALAICLCTDLSSPSYAASKSTTGLGSPVGSWQVTATTISGPQPPSFQALDTYMDGGGII